MRSLRACLTHRRLAPGGVALLAAAMVGVLAASASAANAAATAEPAHPYFPLAVGNRWAYRCSTEGMVSAGKLLQIRQQVQHGGRRYFRAELRVGADALPLVQYFSVDAGGNLRRSLAAPPDSGATRSAANGTASVADSDDVLLAADTAAGSTHGGWVSAGIQRLPVPALPRAQALRIETFSVESPTLPASQRAEWRARYYVRGVGPVGDADGLGGRCDLTAYRLVKPAVSR